MMAAASATSGDSKLDCGPAERNKEPVWKVLESNIVQSLWDKDKNNNAQRRVLEIAAGSGIHMDFFCRQLEQTTDIAVEWFPADMDEAYLASIQARVHELRPALLASSVTVHDPLSLTLHATGIQQDSTRECLLTKDCFDLVLSMNMIHISPWSATVGLFCTAQELLQQESGRLVLYGPYFFSDAPIVPSNVQFDESLRARDPEWGIRTVEAIVQVAREHGLELENAPNRAGIVPMPANNHMLIFRKIPTS